MNEIKPHVLINADASQELGFLSMSDVARALPTVTIFVGPIYVIIEKDFDSKDVQCAQGWYVLDNAILGLGPIRFERNTYTALSSRRINRSRFRKYYFVNAIDEGIQTCGLLGTLWKIFGITVRHLANASANTLSTSCRGTWVESFLTAHGMTFLAHLYPKRTVTIGVWKSILFCIELKFQPTAGLVREQPHTVAVPFKAVWANCRDEWTLVCNKAQKWIEI